MSHISNDLIEAYKGYYENELNIYGTTMSEETGMEAETHINLRVQIMIKSSTSKERLRVYCEWNGIIGYANRLYEIATGEL